MYNAMCFMKFMFNIFILFFFQSSTKPIFFPVIKGAPPVSTKDNFDKSKSYFFKSSKNSLLEDKTEK